MSITRSKASFPMLRGSCYPHGAYSLLSGGTWKEIPALQGRVKEVLWKVWFQRVGNYVEEPLVLTEMIWEGFQLKGDIQTKPQRWSRI